MPLDDRSIAVILRLIGDKDIILYTQLSNKVMFENIPEHDGVVFHFDDECYVIKMKSYEEYEKTKNNESWQIADSTKFYKLTTKPEVCHAEANALNKLTRSNESSEDAALYLTHNPCMECAKNIIMAGISEVYYKYKYRTSEGVTLLMRRGIMVKQIE